MSGVHVRSDEVTWQEVDGDVVVLDLASATYLRIGGAGSVLWPLIVAGSDDSGLAAALVERFAIPVDTARADVEEFLQSLVDQQLVVRDGPTTA